MVGLGGSAGGVKALQEFFATMPPDSGMAFVAVLHLSPEHESSLPQIIQAQTRMKVTQVVKTVKVEPNNVYVIAPNVQLEMVDGVIRPSEANRPHGHRIAIDVFFRTLAEAYQKNAVCIVLSGTGSDGTLGLKRVKESNGFAIVQLPEDAEYDSMPISAINTQLADWVLPVHKMPEKLIHFRESSERLHLTNGADTEQVGREIHADESLRDILTILRVRTGHDFSNYKTPTIIRRIARHLQIHELEDIPTYLELLRKDPNEIQSLLKNLLINVTNFFRDKESFEALQNTVVPKIFDGKTGKDTLRVWSCGCASGEEAYSLAMILQEYADALPDPPKIQVFASDVDEEALSEAREHRYAESIEADISPERLKRFFVREGAYYRVRKELRETVLFAPHNVLRDPPFSRLDLISCRNVLIYLNRQAQERVLEIFHFALVKHGFLFLGSSETADGTGHLFAPIDKKQKIYARRFSAAHNYLPLMPEKGRWDVRMPDDKAKQARERQIALSDIHYKLLENYAPSSVLVNQDFDIVYLSGTAGKFMRYTSGEPSNNILKAVHPDLLPDLRAALFTAQRERAVSEFPNVRMTIDGAPHTVNIIVRAVDVSDEFADFLLVIFEERTLPAVLETAARDSENLRDKDEAMEIIVRRLEQDLQRTKEHLRFTLEQHDTTVEELKAANEELQAINEELRSAGEELETSKEELQSVNEELITVNHEYKEKIEEATRINSDLQNLMAATHIATIFLDKNLNIKRYTPPVEELFNITLRDIGRPLEHFTHHLDFAAMSGEARKVLRTLKPIERETADRDGNTYLARFLPYRTIEDHIDGVVLNFIDISEIKQAQIRVRESEKHFRAFVTASSDVVYIMNADWTEMRFLDGKHFIADTAVTNRDWIEKYILPEDRARVLQRIKEAVRTKSIFELEHRVIRVDGSPGWTFSRAIPLLDDHGKIVEWFGTAGDITDRKEIERALTESEEKYRTLFDSIDEGFCIIEVLFNKRGKPSDYRFLEVNPAFERQTGFKYAVGRTMREIAPDHEKFWFDTYGEIARTGVAKRFEHRAGALNPTRWYDVYAFRLGAPEDRKVAVIFSDIIERRQAELALRESEEHYRAIVNQNLTGIFEIDLKGNVLFANGEFCRMLGYRGKEINDLSVSDFVDAEHLPVSLKKLKEMEKDRQAFEIEIRFVKKDGSFVWVHSSVSPITSGEGKIESAVIISLDITERKRAEEALRKSEEQLQLILESTKDYAIVTFDLQGFITRWKSGAEKIFGYQPEEIIGQPGAIIFTPEDRANKIPEQEMRNALTKGRADDERWHLRKDGSRFFASGVMQPLKDGEMEGFVKIARDQTDRIQTENAVREKETLRRLIRTQEDERRRIARDIHDHFGQQLTSLRLKLAEAKKMCDDLKVCDEIEHADRIAGNLDSEVDFIAWELRPAALDELGLRVTLENFVREWSHHTHVAADFHTAGLSRKRLTFEIETNLYRIAQEALNNIYKHARAQNVSVILEKRKNEVVLIIEDDGIGFNVKNKANRIKGIGLTGMAERAEIVGGTTDIESRKNGGTTVFVRVPGKIDE